MDVDTSAIVAILNGENDGDELELRLMESFPRRLSAANHLELSMVISRGVVPGDLVKFDAYLEAVEIEIMSVTAEDALIAREAFLRYDKGRNRARLNFGDCFACALAKRLGEPLLFKGNDFSQTDVLSA